MGKLNKGGQARWTETDVLCRAQMKHLTIAVAVFLSLHPVVNAFGPRHAPSTEIGVPVNRISKIEPIKPVAPASFQTAETVPRPSPAKPIATSSSSGWHRDCRPQEAAVRAAVDKLGLSGNWTYIRYIFSHESCLDPGRLNSTGCRGLGQACPGSKLPCGPNEITCQVKWFNNYAIAKGGWAASYKIWLSQHWW